MGEVDSASAASAACATHRDRAATGTCARCGAFFCELDSKSVEGKLYCATCAALPEVDWLEAFRRQCWGKRDLGTWVVGGSGALALLGSALAFAEIAWIDGGGSAHPLNQAKPVVFGLAVPGLLAVLFALRVRAARLALAAYAPLLEAVLLASGLGYESLLLTGVPMYFGLRLYLDPRIRLFFRIPISDRALRSLYEARCNNRAARTGFALSLFGIALFPLAPFAIGFSIAGLLQVDPNAKPPIGRKRQAIAGIVLGTVDICLGAALLFWRLRL